MSNISDKLIALVRQLYPTGRAFRVPKDGVQEAFHIATNIELEQLYSDCVAILYSILPDNANFSVSDASEWEVRLGMRDGSANSLSVRMAAILRKLQYPNQNPAKENYLNLQRELQLAGFNLYVYENRFPIYPVGYYTQDPLTLYGASLLSQVQHGDFQHGSIQHGYYFNSKVANHIDEAKDYYFDIGTNFKSTFYVGGNPIGTFGNEPLARKNELRELILKIKPIQTVGFLAINFY